MSIVITQKKFRQTREIGVSMGIHKKGSRGANVSQFNVAAQNQIVSVMPRLLRIHEAARYLGGTNWFIEELMRGNKIRFLVVGKYRVIDVVDLDAWIEEQKNLHSDFSVTKRSVDVAA